MGKEVLAIIEGWPYLIGDLFYLYYDNAVGTTVSGHYGENGCSSRVVI